MQYGRDVWEAVGPCFLHLQRFQPVICPGKWGGVDPLLCCVIKIVSESEKNRLINFLQNRG